MERVQHSSPEFLKEGERSQECESLLPSLPKIVDCIGTPLYRYEGFWYYSAFLQGVLSCQKHFQVQDSDILIASAPASGTTWLIALTFCIVNRDRYPVGSEEHPLLTNNPHDLAPFLDWDLSFDRTVVVAKGGSETNTPSAAAGLALRNAADIPPPRLFATHSPALSLGNKALLTDSGRKVIYICRNPEDNFISMWHFFNELRPEGVEASPVDKAFDMFCNGESIYGPFWDHVLEFWKASLEMPDKVMFIRYEQLKTLPKYYVRKLADFLGRSFSEEEEGHGVVDEIVKLCSFENLSKLEVHKTGKAKNGIGNNYFFRRGEVGDSKNFLSEDMIDKLRRITDEKFTPYGLKI